MCPEGDDRRAEEDRPLSRSELSFGARSIAGRSLEALGDKFADVLKQFADRVELRSFVEQANRPNWGKMLAMPPAQTINIAVPILSVEDYPQFCRICPGLPPTYAEWRFNQRQYHRHHRRSSYRLISVPIDPAGLEEYCAREHLLINRRCSLLSCPRKNGEKARPTTPEVILSRQLRQRDRVAKR